MRRLLPIWKSVSRFLFSILNKEFLIFLFFLVLSGVFWLLMTLNETFEKEIPVRVHLVNVPQNAVMTTEMADTVVITVRDKGFVLSSYFTTRRLQPVAVNFQSYANQSTGRGVVPAADVQKFIYQQLSSSTRISQIKPDKLEFYFNYGRSKKVPVRLTGVVVPAKNYSLVQQLISPQKVTVYANKKVLDSIQYVNTDRLSLLNFNDTVRQVVRLKKVKGVKFVPSSITLTLVPDILTDESLEVPVTAINMPAGKVLRTFPSKVKVRFTVCTSMFRSIKPDQFTVVADYKELSASSSDKCSLYLRAYPHSISKPRLEVDRVDYLIEQQ
ncbi:CdaR family protein [Prevotella sp. KH2C16]|uniref:CdaR family protein n=1 Tax=Prevotella sp. KH2C16 TaxID=1855325 RepID=UPI0008E3E244|nr:YbbR-like domain-containing protein [Prevotella sp. KH2C16]SFG24769.1 YbbR-like protein [Prevotella sp. KH2C16]